MQYNSLKRKRESAFSPNPNKKQIFLPPKQPSCAPVSRRSSRKPLSRPRRPSGFAAETQVKNSPRHQNEKNPENWQLVLDKCKTAGIITNVRQANIAGLCNGSTADSDSVCEGSNPSPAAKEPRPKGCGSFFLAHDLGTFDAEKLHLHFDRIRFTPKFTPIKSFTP